MKTLIAYFSRAGKNYFDGSIKFLKKGNNEVLAEKLKVLLPNADLFKIEPQKPYSDDYTTCIEQAKLDLQKKARPALKYTLDSVIQYEKVYL